MQMPIYIERGSYFTAPEAADFLGVTEGYICKLVNEGRLNGFRVGRLVWLIPADEVRDRKENPPPMGRPKS